MPLPSDLGIPALVWFTSFHAGLMMILMVNGSTGMKRIVVQVVNRFATAGADRRHRRPQLVSLAVYGPSRWRLVLAAAGSAVFTGHDQLQPLLVNEYPDAEEFADPLASSGNSMLSMVMQLAMSIGVTIAGMLLGMFGQQHLSADAG